MPEETRTFDGAIQKFKAWSEVRFNEREALALISHFYFSITNPDHNPKLRTLWNDFHNVTLLEIKDRLDNTDWANTDGEVLVLLMTASIEIRKGMNNFLPLSVSQPFTEEHKDSLWIWHLLNNGLRLQPQEPYCLLHPWARLLIGGAYASIENGRRTAKYPVTFATGLVGYFSNSPEGNTPEARQMIKAAKRIIARAAREYIPAAIRPDQTSLEEQVEETLIKDFFRGSAEAIYARALNGLNVAPQVAVAMDVIDKNKSQQSKFERAIELEESDEKIAGLLNSARSTASAEEMLVAIRKSELVKKFEAKYPDDWALIDAIRFQGKSPKELSTTDPRKPDAIQRAFNRAIDKLRDFLDDPST